MKQEFNQILDEANRAYTRGDFSYAKRLFAQARDLNPENPVPPEYLGLISLWENRVSEGESYLTAAKKAIPWYKRIWPFTASTDYRLAMSHYRHDRSAAASRYFLNAAGPFPLGTFQELKALGIHQELLSDKPAYVIDGPDECRIPFIVIDPLPVIRVSVNDREPELFFIDTGGSDVILDTGFAQGTGIDVISRFNGAYAGNKKAVTGLGKADSLNAGDFIVRNVPVHILDLQPISSVFDGLPIKGCIGTRFLMHFLATIDYPGRSLILRRASSGNMQRFESQVKRENQKTIPFWLIDMHVMVAQGTVNGSEPVLMFIDTGLANGGFIPSNTDLKLFGIEPDWTKAEEFSGGGGKCRAVRITLHQITLGSGADQILRTNVTGVVLENSVPYLGDSMGFHIGGLISHGFFRNSSLTFDFSEMRLYVKENPDLHHI